jgi:hypothetical protein
MAGSTEKTENSAPASGDKENRDQSTIIFPYGDLDDAADVARAIMSCGGVPVDPDQLAAALSQTPTSGSFRAKVSTARIFGVIETVAGKYQLTDIGFAVADQDAIRQRTARVEAFLRVPLYRRVYEEFRNRQLPPRPAALEHAFVGFGVAQKQKDRARQAFDRSAQQAGFFDQAGRNRLIRPPIAGSTEAPEAAPEQGAAWSDSPPPQPSRGNGSGTGGGGHHPFIEGLLERLPQPDTVWSIEGRAAWLEAAASVFKLIYQGDGKITVTAQHEREQRH